jgi:hypothetical protein
VVGTITTSICASFRLELGGAIHDLLADTIKCALIKNDPTGTYGKDTVNYSNVTGNSDEATGTGYVAGGLTLAGKTLTLSNNVIIFDFDDPTWAASTIAANGALFYNASKANRAIGVLNFNGRYSSLAQNFQILMPAGLSSTALIRW